ncbi:MAG TPA: aminoglycoside phosphotransferase family protein [Usitatibacter sp.]|jgi:aminoglycoside phosphotransferase (APT) family kinase protein|nr:aminoglycoside phosphotransferase family protein [Usitatibacter sp.]
MIITVELVRALLRAQFPQWSGLNLRATEPPGWDNCTLRLGGDLLVRLPTDAAYAHQVDKEQQWLPRLARHLPLTIPSPVAMGRPTSEYPWNWSIYRWIEADASSLPTSAFARELGEFLQALQRIDATGGPGPGRHNFHRGGDLAVYDEEVRRALVILEGRVEAREAMRLWRSATATNWDHPAVWIHGDISRSNLLTRSHRLTAVIDFGNLAVGDPACDLAIGWSWFDRETCEALRTALPLDDATWLRGRAWSLWKALVVAAGISPTNAIEHADPMRVVQRCLAD